jgi:hypothetical protein
MGAPTGARPTNPFHPYPDSLHAFHEVCRFGPAFLPHREFFVLLFLAERLCLWRASSAQDAPWGKESDGCSWSQMQRGVRGKGKLWRAGTGQAKSQDCYGIRDLIERQILKCEPGDGYTHRSTRYRVDWQRLSEFFEQKKTEKITKLAAKRTPKQAPDPVSHENQAPPFRMKTNPPCFAGGPDTLNGSSSIDSPSSGSSQIGSSGLDGGGAQPALSTTPARASLAATEKADDEKHEKPKPEYASARDEVKDIYFAKTGGYPSFQLLDRIESILATKGQTFDSFLDVLKPHLGGNWRIPGAFLTHVAKTMVRIGLEDTVSPPQEKPKPKCPICRSANQRGAIFGEDDTILPCPKCSTQEWREELAAKEVRKKLTSAKREATRAADEKAKQKPSC